ncbi:MAG: ATP-binding cassette domain-containing protein, partial [Chloroflexota bacterium]
AGNTIVVAEHRLHYLLDVYDSVIYMESGKIAGRYSREAFVNIPEDERKQMGLRAIRKPILRDAQTQMEAVSSIIVETLTCRHGSKLAVQIEKLRLPKHKVIALVGKNGAGKSTFAAGFSGIHKATARIIDEKALSRRERLKRTFLVMQDVNHQLFTESVLDELMLGRAFDDAELIEQAEATLNQLNLLPWRDEHPQCLSGGQKQRTAIATALFAQKSYLIFDEPTSGVDLIHMMRVAELIQEIKDHVACVLVITHDVEFINYCCEYVIELDAGRVINAYALAVHP